MGGLEATTASARADGPLTTWATSDAPRKCPAGRGWTQLVARCIGLAQLAGVRAAVSDEPRTA
jgi:hypothetical protein